MQPTQIIGHERRTSDPQRTQKTQIHSNNYPSQGEMKLDTIKGTKKD
jgi:hypothetical protein